jgi:hypothetical protein
VPSPLLIVSAQVGISTKRGAVVRCKAARGGLADRQRLLVTKAVALPETVRVGPWQFESRSMEAKPPCSWVAGYANAEGGVGMLGPAGERRAEFIHVGDWISPRTAVRLALTLWAVAIVVTVLAIVLVVLTRSLPRPAKSQGNATLRHPSDADRPSGRPLS